MRKRTQGRVPAKQPERTDKPDQETSPEASTDPQYDGVDTGQGPDKTVAHTVEVPADMPEPLPYDAPKRRRAKADEPAPKKRRRKPVSPDPDKDESTPQDIEADASKQTTEVEDQSPSDEAPSPAHQSNVRSAIDLQMGGGFDALVETVFTQDTAQDFAAIMQSLAFDLKPSRMEYGMLVDALDKAPGHSARALQIVANAKVARKGHEAECDVLLSSMRSDARDALEHEGAKRPTIADIDGKMASMFHDEYREIKERLAKASALVEYLDGMSRVVQERARDIRQMVSGATARH